MLYIPALFAETDRARLYEFMRQHSFATLISGTAPDPSVSHIPFLVDAEHSTLRGHVARANPQWRTLHSSSEVLVIFNGPHHYVSPSWYAVHPSVPTWNYAVVHAHGRPRIIDERAELERLVADLVAEHERHLQNPWKLDLPPDYMHSMLSEIVGFEIEVTRLAGKFKLSQNRPAFDHPRVVSALEAIGGDEARKVALLMRDRQSR
ncbi:MAG: FMN-binding negative transcriptional regulator [Burkholderiales bacterium]